MSSLSKFWPIMAAIALLGIAFYFYYSPKTVQNPPPPPQAPAFTQDGSLTFWQKASGDSLASIAIEIADTEEKMELGLMFRQTMEERQGMLFIYQDEGLRNFWMKSTQIPLDIIYVNAQQQIVTIQKNTVPYSESPVPSTAPAQYVVEVNAGFSDRFQLKEGDLITFERG
ncbi:MAG: DUF192 domain-containing protein [Bacteroidota bacterium]